MRLGVRVFQGAAAFALLLASAVSIDAAPFTAHFEALQAELREKRDGIADDSTLERLALRARLSRALALLDARSVSVRRDLRTAVRLGRVLAPDLESNEEISTGMDTAVLGLAGEVQAPRDALAARVAGVVNARASARATDTLGRVDGALDRARTGDPVVARVAGLATALREIGTENALLDRLEIPRGAPGSRLGRGRFAALAVGEPWEPPYGGGHATLDAAGAVRELFVVGHGRRPTDSALQISWSTGAFTGPGTYVVDGASGLSAFVTSGTRLYLAESGEVTVTSFDPATRRIAGTFRLVVRTEDGSGWIDLERGWFRVAAYAVTR